MLDSSLKVHSYVLINDGCPMKITVHTPDQVEITCGWPPNQSFDFVMEREALRDLVALSSDALARMDAAIAPDATVC